MSTDERFPDGVRYSEHHDWAYVGDTAARFGVTWYAQDLLGEIVYFDAPSLGATVTRGEPYSELESVKAVSDVIAPLSGISLPSTRGSRLIRQRSTAIRTATAGSSRSG